MPSKKAEPEQAQGTAPEIVPADQAIPIPEEAKVPEEANPPGPPPVSPRRAHWKGQPTEYLGPLLEAERDPATGVVTERIFYPPARDLTDAEWQVLTPSQRQYLRDAHRLYDVASDAQVRGGK